MKEKRGSLGFASTYRPPLPLDIFSSPALTTTVSKQHEVHMSDGVSYNYNGREIPPAALKTILKRPTFTNCHYDVNEVASGALTGMVFVSERDGGLETLHIAIRGPNGSIKVFSVAEVFGTFNGVRMEDSGSVAVGGGGGDYLIYITTKDPSHARRHPWTAVYKTKLTTGETTRLTPIGHADLSPSVHPSGTKIAVASFEGKTGGWEGEIEDLQTNIFVVNVERPCERKLVVKNGGWPTWGSENVLFFHRKVGELWGVFRVDIGGGCGGGESRVTPDGISAMTPAAINATTVAVATIRQESKFGDIRVEAQYRHIEIFKYCPNNQQNAPPPIQITRQIRPMADHFNPFVINGGESRVTPHGISAMNATTVAVATNHQESNFGHVHVEAQHHHNEMFQYCPNNQQNAPPPIQITHQIRPTADHFNPFEINNGIRIGYHRCKTDHELEISDDTQMHFNKLDCPHPDVGLFRVPGMFPTFSKDGSKLAFVDNEFKDVWVADSEGLRIVYKGSVAGHVFSPAWNRDPTKDILYVNSGPAFSANDRLDIIAIHKVSKAKGHSQLLTKEGNNAFPCTNPDGTKLVFRSTLNGGSEKHKNLYIMNDVKRGEYGNCDITRLTNGPWTDTHCQWSPSGDWIVFSSSRDKPTDKLDELDNGLDPGYFSVYLVKADDPNVCVRVITSGNDGAGHVNHPFFSPDGMSIIVTSDLAGVSADPISLPLFMHSVRPYGDIFIIDIDPHNIKRNKNTKNFKRITHSRYENSTASWTKFSTNDSHAAWNELFDQHSTPLCDVLYHGRGKTSYHIGSLCIRPKKS